MSCAKDGATCLPQDVSVRTVMWVARRLSHFLYIYFYTMSQSTKNDTQKKNWFRRHWIITSIMVLVFLSMISNGDDRQGDNNQPEAKQYVDISCSDFASQFGAKSDLSDLQKDEIFKDYDGKYVKWTGTVSSISSTFGQLKMQVKCSPTTLVSDAIISFDDSEKEALLQIKEGETVNFEAQLDSWGQLIPTTLRKGIIEN